MEYEISTEEMEHMCYNAAPVSDDEYKEDKSLIVYDD